MNLGDRMKANYENRYRSYLTRRTPVIMRLDGKSFHTITKECDKPFDSHLRGCMVTAAKSVLAQAQGAQCAYIQSDEINVLLVDYKRLSTEAWLNYNVQKMTSIAASICSVAFSRAFEQSAYFDCRVFNIPEAEVCNYFIWRQKDWERNSLFMLANVFYSAKQLHKKGKAEIHEMLYEIGENWADLPSIWKNGTWIGKAEALGRSFWQAYHEPIFTENREIIESLLITEEE